MPQTCQIRTHAPQQAASLLVSLIADGIGPKNRFSNKGAPGVDGQDFGFFHGAFQPHLDQIQHPPINDPARYRLFACVDSVCERIQVGLC